MVKANGESFLGNKTVDQRSGANPITQTYESRAQVTSQLISPKRGGALGTKNRPLLVTKNDLGSNYRTCPQFFQGSKL